MNFFLTLTVRGLFHRKDFKRKKIWGYGVNFWKNPFYTQNLTKERKQPLVVIPEQAILYSIFILCLCLRIIGTSDQDLYFMNFPSHIFFNNIRGYRAAILKKNSLLVLPFYMVFSIMKRCAERCALQLHPTSWS